MEYTEKDRAALYDVWMSQKAKMHLTQMEMTRKLGINHNQFSGLIRGNEPLNTRFIRQLCEHLHVDPYRVIPSLSEQGIQAHGNHSLSLTNRVKVPGKVKKVYVENNEVVIEYSCPITD